MKHTTTNRKRHVFSIHLYVYGHIIVDSTGYNVDWHWLHGWGKTSTCNMLKSKHNIILAVGWVYFKDLLYCELFIVYSCCMFMKVSLQWTWLKWGGKKALNMRDNHLLYVRECIHIFYIKSSLIMVIMKQFWLYSINKNAQYWYL